MESYCLQRNHHPVWCWTDLFLNKLIMKSFSPSSLSISNFNYETRLSASFIHSCITCRRALHDSWLIEIRLYPHRVNQCYPQTQIKLSSTSRSVRITWSADKNPSRFADILHLSSYTMLKTLISVFLDMHVCRTLDRVLDHVRSFFSDIGVSWTYFSCLLSAVSLSILLISMKIGFHAQLRQVLRSKLWLELFWLILLRLRYCLSYFIPMMRVNTTLIMFCVWIFLLQKLSHLLGQLQSIIMDELRPIWTILFAMCAITVSFLSSYHVLVPAGQLYDVLDTSILSAAFPLWCVSYRTSMMFSRSSSLSLRPYRTSLSL